MLNRWLLSLFAVERLDAIARHLRDEALGLDESNVHHFHHALAAQFPNLSDLPVELLLEYDQQIVAHTLNLNERRVTRREEPIIWKYFQYLALLFTEIYLDRYFSDPRSLMQSLNAQIIDMNANRPVEDLIAEFDTQADPERQLNRIAMWCATGSGKTLLMHVNILQYRHYLRKSGRSRALNHIILLTPNEGLSQQHLDEFRIAGFSAELFKKDAPGLFAGDAVEIIDMYKLRDEMGPKTVAIDAFEGNNLVLVDEGHRGSSSGDDGTWMRFRNALCETGFCFEYSATFGQAVKGDSVLTNVYAKSILFDYSYRYFHGDGFGKAYEVLNLDESTQDSHLELYLVACLLSFFQQQLLFREHEASFRAFNIEKPLWIFVGGSVTKTLPRREASDIVEILTFIARYLSDRDASVQRIETVINQGIVNSDGRNLFAGRFAYLNALGLSPAQLYQETLTTVFNAATGGQLHLENLSEAVGEVALRLGDNDPFGVVNVGDDDALVKLCVLNGLQTAARTFSGSLFNDINKPHSTVNVLIGSKKFTEGWNSWRVSTMGLLNVGRSEGSQIIQLFGRGVRLKGYDSSLKRSGSLQLPDGVIRPKYLSLLETLSVFGVRADYMAQFRSFLEEEGVPLDDAVVEFFLPVVINLGTQKLKTIRLRQTINGVSTDSGDAFRKLGPAPTLARPDPTNDPATEYLQKNQVVLNWYPKIRTMKSGGARDGDGQVKRNQAHLGRLHIAFIDLDRIYFELQQFKAERGLFELNLTRAAVEMLLLDHSWYQLLIPEEELVADSFDRVRLWEQIALSLLKKYVEQYYAFRKREWELPHLEYRDLTEDDPNFPGPRDGSGGRYYRILIERSAEEVVMKLSELDALIQSGTLKPWAFRGMKAVWFGRHLYEPLLYVDQDIVRISPMPLNKGERRFVEDLKTFYDSTPDFFADKELYLLRNLSRGRGVGFFEAGNFHPDFIVWLTIRGEQHVLFVDPKGIRNLGASDRKIQFYKTVKEIERRLGDGNVHLHSFIVSNTPSHIMQNLWGIDKAAMTARHILFQEEEAGSYVKTMFELALSAQPGVAPRSP